MEAVVSLEININLSLAKRLADKDGEARLRSICESLKECNPYVPRTGKKECGLDSVLYGVGGTPFRAIADVLRVKVK